MTDLFAQSANQRAARQRPTVSIMIVGGKVRDDSDSVTCMQLIDCEATFWSFASIAVRLVTRPSCLLKRLCKHLHLVIMLSDLNNIVEPRPLGYEGSRSHKRMTARVLPEPLRAARKDAAIRLAISPKARASARCTSRTPHNVSATWYVDR